VAIEFGEEFELDREIFGRGLDRNIYVDVFPRELRPNAGERRAPLAVGQPALLESRGEILLDRAQAALDEFLAAIVEQDGVAGLRRNLRDPRAHLPGPDNENGMGHYTLINTASPWPPPLQIAAMP